MSISIEQREILNDGRYSIQLEFCGYSKARYVARFCGVFINSSMDKITTLNIALHHNKARF